jgi:hypothetical protein
MEITNLTFIRRYFLPSVKLILTTNSKEKDTGRNNEAAITGSMCEIAHSIKDHPRHLEIAKTMEKIFVEYFRKRKLQNTVSLNAFFTHLCLFFNCPVRI